jgi:hypothetical protein
LLFPHPESTAQRVGAWLRAVLGMDRFIAGHGGWRIRKRRRRELAFDLVREEDEEGAKWTT